jgi:D-psicose/D-tagatose/L-ribulose 3-epimerase
MRIGISNIAWDVSEDERIASLLQRYAVDSIDVAPAKYFPEPEVVDAQAIMRVKDWWQVRGIEITGLQALMFGTTGLNVFGARDVQEAMLKHLGVVARIGAELGATKLVFGSPKNRDRRNLSTEVACVRAISFFRRLGDIASSHGVVFCLEPNPACYGANFMLDSTETALIVNSVSHPAIKMQFDTGAITINNEAPAAVAAAYKDIIGHIHLSEPELATLGDGTTDHAVMQSAMSEYYTGRVATIEMRSKGGASNLAAVEQALNVAIRYYRTAVAQ